MRRLPSFSTTSTGMYSTITPRLPFALSLLLLPYLVNLELPMFSPRLLIFSPLPQGLLSLFLAPWTLPSTPNNLLSRLLQSLISCLIPSPTPSGPKTNLLIYLLWILVGLTRTLMGFILTRSVGWKYPAWFSHQALYEPCEGIGAGLILLLVMALAKQTTSTSNQRRLEEKDERIDEDRGKTRALWMGIGLVGMTWLEQRIWTYSITWGLGIIIIYPLTRFYFEYVKSGSGRVLNRHRNRDRGEGKLLLPPLTPPSPTKRSSWTRIGRYPFFIILVLGTINTILLQTTRKLPPRLPYPRGTKLDVIILSYPRPPSVEVSMNLLDETLGSFVRSVETRARTGVVGDLDIGVSVFTHSREHEALDRVREKYERKQVMEEGSLLEVGWKVDRDVHEGDQDGHFLHLAEAFRYALEMDRGGLSGQTQGGEEGVQNEEDAGWILLVEDDFPVCLGGWAVIETVMNRLAWWREEKGVVLSAFIGTGGSGFIIHRSYLPILIRLLRTYSSLDTTFPSSIHRPFPDQLVQTCLLGLKDGLCERRPSEPDEPIMIIPSRLVLDHQGGMATTTEGKGLNSDRWRCGWRHPFHGFNRVEVVEV